jgi:carboxymethylenebutenolidase
MTDLSPAPVIQAEWVSIAVPAATGVAATAMAAWWARPAPGLRLRGAVLVLPEVFGVNGWVRGVAERLAAEGYAALAISTFARTAPDLDVPYNKEGLAAGRQHRDQVTADQLLADVAAAAAWLQQRHAAALLGCVGFCFGGHLAMLAATLPVIAATCDFYGARVSSDRPGAAPGDSTQPPTLAVVPQVPGRLWCFCGDQDPLMPAEEIAAIGEALSQEGERHRLLIAAGAGHGYMCEARADFHAEAARAGWSAMLALFAETLG